MRQLSRITLTLVFAIATASAAFAHIGTEVYIPIGKSPGISGEHSYIGEITERETEGYGLMLDRAHGGYSNVEINEETRIYLDRSKMGKRNLRGSYSDCRPGRRIEVKFRDNDPSQPAEWIKVEVAE